MIRLSLLALCLLLISSPLSAQREAPPEGVELGPAQQIMSPEQAIREIFSRGLTSRRDTLHLSLARIDSLQQILHRPIRDTTVIVRRFYRNNSLTGYAVVTNEYGKYRPITMLVGVNPDFSVRGVRILVYRENRGGEVKRKRFLYQYRGMTTEDPIRINRDIINISGATISVRGVNSGVRKVLNLLEMLYGGSTP